MNSVMILLGTDGSWSRTAENRPRVKPAISQFLDRTVHPHILCCCQPGAVHFTFQTLKERAMSNETSSGDSVQERVTQLAKEGISIPPVNSLKFKDDKLWGTLRGLGTELWLDTGDLEKASELWNTHNSALTTNNTLLNKEVSKGIYDELIRTAVRNIRELVPEISSDGLVKEIGVLLNAHHGLRLVETFGCKVSVELHTDLAHDFSGILETAHRLYNVCPSNFIIKVPLTATGLLAVRRLVKEGMPINFTLEFSARQNYLAAKVANPNFVNVFLGRLNSFVADFGLGDGKFVGEKATLSSQNELLRLRKSGEAQTRQIAASMRDPEQVVTLAGLDVMTIPTAVAEDFKTSGIKPEQLEVNLDREFQVQLAGGIDEKDIGLDTLWEVPESLKDAVDELLNQDVDTFTGNDLTGFLARKGFADFLPHWSEEQFDTITSDGKLPSYDRWKSELKAKELGLDALFNAAGLCSFAADQKQLDDRIRSFL